MHHRVASASLPALRAFPGLREAERSLQTQDNGVATTSFECDDTLFECEPVCVESVGVVRFKVSEEKCSGVKPDACSCRCFYDAYRQPPQPMLF